MTITMYVLKTEFIHLGDKGMDLVLFPFPFKTLLYFKLHEAHEAGLTNGQKYTRKGQNKGCILRS